MRKVGGRAFGAAALNEGEATSGVCDTRAKSVSVTLLRTRSEHFDDSSVRESCGVLFVKDVLLRVS